MATADDEGQLRAAILALARARGPHKTLCPSEAARAVDPDGWRDLMDATRRVAWSLHAEGVLDVLQKGQPVTPSARGPIRLRIRPP